MSLSTESAKEALTKITGIPEGRFKEARSNTRGAITIRIFECEEDGDEYSVIANSKDEIIEVKSSFAEFDAVAVKYALNPPTQGNPLPGPKEAFTDPNDPNNTNPNPIIAPLITPNQLAGMLSGQIPNGPYHAPTIPFAQSQLMDVNIVKNFVVSTLMANPGCVSRLFPSLVVETEAHNLASWELEDVSADASTIDFIFCASNAKDPQIAQLYAQVAYDLVNNKITEFSLDV